MKHLESAVKIGAAVIMSITLSWNAQAAGSDYSEIASGSCGENMVWSSVSNKCLEKTAEILTDDDYYKQSVELIKAEKYKQGLDLLWRIKKQEQPEVLNYLGYANRKLGKVDEGIEYYKKALKLDADFHPARQYLGEGYIQKGDLKNARAQLKELEKRCRKDCEHYISLEKEIKLAEANAKKKK